MDLFFMGGGNSIEGGNGGSGEETSSAVSNIVSVPSQVLCQASPAVASALTTPNQQVIIIENSAIWAENNKLKGELEEAKRRIAEAEKNLEEARMEGDKRRREVEGLVPKEDFKEMKKLVGVEMKMKEEAQEELGKLKESVDRFSGEVTGLVGTDTRREGEGNENPLEDVRAKFQKLSESEKNLKEALAKKTEEVGHLQKILKGKQPPSREESGSGGALVPAASSMPVFKSFLSGNPRPALLEGRAGSKPEGRLEVALKRLHFEKILKGKEGYFCVCGGDYSSRSSLNTHIRLMTEQGKFECGVCKERFLRYCFLRRHQQDRHDMTPSKKQFGCGFCGKLFPKFGDLQRHRQFSHPHVSKRLGSKIPSRFGRRSPGRIPMPPPVAPEPVAHCSKNPPNQTIPGPGQRHGLNYMRRHVGVYCVCGVKLLTRVGLQGHLRFWKRRALLNQGRPVYPLPPREEIKQEEDSSTASSSEENRLPKKKHGRHPYHSKACLCGFRTCTRYGLRQHIVYHTRERKFFCNLCPRKFVGHWVLRRHYLVTHRDVRRYNEMRNQTGCRTCGKAFSNRVAFRRHQKMAHGGNSKKGKGVPAVATSAESFESEAPGGHGVDLTQGRRGHFCRCGRRCLSNAALILHIKHNEGAVEPDIPAGSSESPEPVAISVPSENVPASPSVPGVRAGHEAGHDADGKPSCSCGQKFSSEGYLRSHIRIQGMLDMLRSGGSLQNN